MTLWKPTCSLEMLHLRADLLTALRSFFRTRDYLEVETPLLSSDVVVDAHLDPFVVDHDGRTGYLQTSPEAAMKRLLAAGSGSIFQVTKSFRRGEQGRLHNPEFTMVEWYGVACSWGEQMDLTTSLIRHLGDCISADVTDRWWHSDVRRTSYDDAYRREVGVSVLDLADEELTARADELNLPIAPDTLSRDDLLNLILAEQIEPRLGVGGPEFLIEYPLSQAALAVQNPDDPRTACRFELYVNGLELCNGYQELTDADELRIRDLNQNDKRNERRAEGLPGAERMMAAMQAGLPECSGVALGFDRLVMALTGTTDIASVIPFPADRA